MASVSMSQQKDKQLSRTTEARGGVSLEGPIFLAICSALSLFCWSQMRHGYLSADALQQYADALILDGANGSRSTFMALLYPHATRFLGLLLGGLPGLSAEMSPYLVGILATAATLTLAWRDIARSHGRLWALILILPFAAHPFLLWTASSAGSLALALLVFYAICRTLRRLEGDPDTATYFGIGGWLCLLLMIDARAVFICAGLLPWLAWTAPERAMRHSPTAFYLVCYVPAVMALAAWAYINWLYLGDGLAFLSDPPSAFRCGATFTDDFPRLHGYDGNFLAPLLWTALAGMAAFPSLLLLPYASEGVRKAVLCALLTIISAAGLATMAPAASQVLGFLPLLAAPTLLGLAAICTRQRLLVLGLLLLSLPASWAAMQYQQTEDVRNWLAALGGGSNAQPYRDEIEVGEWLADTTLPTLIGQRFIPAILAGRKSAEGLLLASSATYGQAVSGTGISSPQIVVADPASSAGEQDEIACRFPSLWKSGLPGYRLVFERGVFRVWRKATL